MPKERLQKKSRQHKEIQKQGIPIVEKQYMHTPLKYPRLYSTGSVDHDF